MAMVSNEKDIIILANQITCTIHQSYFFGWIISFSRCTMLSNASTSISVTCLLQASHWWDRPYTDSSEKSTSYHKSNFVCCMLVICQICWTVIKFPAILGPPILCDSLQYRPIASTLLLHTIIFVITFLLASKMSVLSMAEALKPFDQGIFFILGGMGHFLHHGNHFSPTHGHLSLPKGHFSPP